MELIIKNNYNIKFQDYDWHEAILKNVFIDRTNSGNNDTITMDIIWPDDTSSRVVFIDVYKAILELNFRFMGIETLYNATILNDNDLELELFKEQWKDFNAHKVHCHVFETAPGGSKIKIFAQSFKIVD